MVGSQNLESHHFVCHLYATQPNLESVDVAQMHQFDDSIPSAERVKAGSFEPAYRLTMVCAI